MGTVPRREQLPHRCPKGIAVGVQGDGSQFCVAFGSYPREPRGIKNVALWECVNQNNGRVPNISSKQNSHDGFSKFQDNCFDLYPVWDTL